MRLFSCLKFQIFTLSVLFIYCQQSWGSQDAIVTSDEAVIFSDIKMSSPVGFVKKGKRIKVGEFAKNKLQVFPIIVSGKIAYIRANDISVERSDTESNQLVAERFQRAAQEEKKARYGLAYFTYASQFRSSNDNGGVKNNDNFPWTGSSLKGEVIIKNAFDLQVLTNFMVGRANSEEFRVTEFGFGTSYRLIETKRFTTRIEAQLLGIPFASYSYGSLFRVNGYGYSMGGGLNLAYKFTKHLGLDVFGGMYLTKIMGLNVPAPYSSISPSFLGTRLGLGAYYAY